MSRSLLNASRVAVLSVSLCALSVVFWTACTERMEGPSEPAVVQEDVLSKANPQVQAVMAVQERYTAGLMAASDVIGTATGLTEDGKLAILVFATSEVRTKADINVESLAKGLAPDAIPVALEGVPVVVEVTEPFRALKTTTSSVSHKAKQTPPIQLGTSGGWRYDLANGYCCGGTLGSLVQKGGVQYILSNYHVLYADIVSGGNNKIAQAGDAVINPGLIDVGCNANNAQNVATLEGTKSLPSSNVDAGIAQIAPNMVRTDGAILEIGTISASTVGASIYQKVKKSGRTTGLTRSTVSGLNATVGVSYDNECAGGDAFTKTFTGQIIVKNKGSRFIAGGDSGSLMVQDVSTNPKAVGLLFAGSSTLAVANPIGQVLSFFDATMVGQ